VVNKGFLKRGKDRTDSWPRNHRKGGYRLEEKEKKLPKSFVRKNKEEITMPKFCRERRAKSIFVKQRKTNKGKRQSNGESGHLRKLNTTELAERIITKRRNPYYQERLRIKPDDHSIKRKLNQRKRSSKKKGRTKKKNVSRVGKSPEKTR